MTVTVAGLPFDFVPLSEAAGYFGIFFKSTADAYQFSGTTLTKVTDVNYPTTTVRGAVYLDGTFYVMTPSGQVRGSALENPLVWDPLNVIVCQAEPDTGVAIARHLNYVVGFCNWTTTFFYDAGNPTGSPLLPQTSAALEVGCAAAGSVSNVVNTLVFMGVTRQAGRSIYALDGTTPEIISTPWVDRILNADDLTKVYSYSIRSQGHIFYLLTLGSLGVTLVYDFTTKEWHEWSSLTAQPPVNIVSLSQTNGTAYANATSHGLTDGGLATITGPSIGDYTQYNGTYPVNVIDANNFSYPVASDAPSPAVGSFTVTNLKEGYFDGTFYTAAGGTDVIQSASTGNVYKMSPTQYTDNGTPILCRIRTPNLDGGTSAWKHFQSLTVIGDKVTSTLYVRYTNDDYQTWSNWRPVDLSQSRAWLTRLGRARRRAFEFVQYDAVALRLEAVDLDITPEVKGGK